MAKQLFYVFDEHTDYVQMCEKLGMKPIKGYPYVEEFDFGGVMYKTLSIHECYSGWEITIMALPCMNYSQLIETLCTTTIYDEIVGCLGVLLKRYLQEFTVYLAECPMSDRRARKVKKIILNELAIKSTHVSSMKQLLEICL